MFREGSVEPLLYPEPTLSFAWNPQLEGIGSEWHEFSSRRPSPTQDDLFTIGGSLDELREVGLGLGDIDDLGHDANGSRMTKLVNLGSPARSRAGEPHAGPIHRGAYEALAHNDIAIGAVQAIGAGIKPSKPDKDILIVLIDP